MAVLAAHFWKILEKFGVIQVEDRWRARLSELLEESNTLHNTTTTLRGGGSGFSGNAQTLTAKTAKTHLDNQNVLGKVQNPTAKTAKTPPEAERFGLVATWSIEFGYVSLHDPTTGEWHDVPTKEAPSWAMWEARKRKELYRSGNRKAFRLTSSEMGEIWATEYVPEPEGIIEDHPMEEEGRDAP